jgi:hypothetical protein
MMDVCYGTILPKFGVDVKRTSWAIGQRNKVTKALL